MRWIGRLWAVSRVAWFVYRRLSTIGRVFFAVAIVAFGAQLLIHGGFAAGLIPAQPWTPALRSQAYVLGIFFVLAGLALCVPKFEQCAAYALAGVIAACLVVTNARHIPELVAHGTVRTTFLEPLAIGSIALVLGALAGEAGPANRAFDRVGRLLFAFALVIFGIQHFLYAGYLVTLVPAWMPLHLELIYFTGAGFIAAGIAIGVNVLARLGAGLIGLMFFLWLFTLHGPRLAAAPGNYAEWASFFIALAMCGSGLILTAPAATARR